MNNKIQAILLRLTLHLKKLKWTPSAEWEITLKSQNQVELQKYVDVDGELDDDEWKDQVQTNVDLTLSSEDQITFFPKYTIYASYFIDGAGVDDFVFQAEADIAFTENDYNNEAKITSAADRINRSLNNYIQDHYTKYVDTNGNEITAYKKLGSHAPDIDHD